MSNSLAALVYPHQLWKDNPAIASAPRIVLVEDPLFFSQYNFHGQKLVLHRASMTEFAAHCKSMSKKVERIESRDVTHSADIGEILKNLKIKQVLAVDPTDVWLKDRVSQGCASARIAIQWLDDPAFLTPVDVMQRWAENRKHYHFTDFYLQQRKRLRLLLDVRGKPIGGKWTFDTENRKKLPKDIALPGIMRPAELESVREAREYVAKRFPNALGQTQDFGYPVSYKDADIWLKQFVETRLEAFGDYEDAISRSETFVFHGVLTPMLNIGLLTPQQIIDAVLEKAGAIPLNSLEGFLRQVIGWRVRATRLSACRHTAANAQCMGAQAYTARLLL